MSLEYYQDEDVTYACLGVMGSGGIFQLARNATNTSDWRFLAPVSPAWDAAHQEIYRNLKVRPLPDDKGAELPSLPPTPSGPFPSKEDYYLPESAVSSEQFPKSAAWVSSFPDQTATAHIVLFEDYYETSLGDGCFRYFETAFCTAKEAADYCEEQKRKHLREMTLVIREDTFQFPNFKLATFDHYEPVQVLGALEKTISAETQRGKK